jgi:hypothetical protein
VVHRNALENDQECIYDAEKADLCHDEKDNISLGSALHESQKKSTDAELH